MPNATKAWASLLYLIIFCVFIWLFFSSSVDAFEIPFPTEEQRDEFVGKPTIYKDPGRGVNVASLLTKEELEYQYLFIFPPADMPNRIQVYVGNIPISDADIQFLSSTKLRIFTPKSQPGTARIFVTNPDEQSSQEDVAYIYNAPPKVTGISPGSGTVGTKITLTGENFIEKILDEFISVTIGGITVDKDKIEFVDSTRIQFPRK